jgi:hypothetical protein
MLRLNEAVLSNACPKVRIEFLVAVISASTVALQLVACEIRVVLRGHVSD